MLAIHDGNQPIDKCSNAFDDEMTGLCRGVYDRVPEGWRARGDCGDPCLRPIMETVHKVSQGSMGGHSVLVSGDVSATKITTTRMHGM